MKEVTMFLKRNYMKMLWIAIAVAAMVWVFLILHEIATNQRECNAIGGEIGIFVLPFIGYFLYRVVKDTIPFLKNK